MKPRPSNAKLWSRCSASLLGVEPPMSENAKEGIELHEQTQMYLEALKTSPDFNTQRISNNAVRHIIEHLRSVCQFLVIEDKVPIRAIDENAHGRIDAYYYTRNSAGRYDVHIYDFKYGHAHVNAEENPQLMLYADALRSKMPIDNFTVHILQPRVYYGDDHSTYNFNNLHLDRYIAKLRIKLEEAQTGQHKATTGRHCIYCPLRSDCSAFRNACSNLTDLIDVPYNEGKATALSLASERERLITAKKMLTARLEAIEDTLMHKVKNGDTSSGLRIESRQGAKKWKVPVTKAIREVSQRYGIDISELRCLTPGQAAEKIPSSQRGVFFKELAHLWSAKSSEKLVKAEDTLAAKFFV